MHVMRSFFYSLLLTLPLVSVSFGEAKKDTAAEGESVSEVDPKASELFAKARAGRRVWDDNFPGFGAKLNILHDEKTYTGSIQVRPDGIADVTFDNPEAMDKETRNNLEELFTSMASHRTSDSGALSEPEPMVFPEGDESHAWGPLVGKQEDKYGSTYRIRDGHISVVNRKMGPAGNFAISMLRQVKTDDGRVLPGAYNFSVWDNKGNLVKSVTNDNQWSKFGNYYLPTQQRVITTGPNQWSAMEINYSDHKLDQSSAASASTADSTAK